MKKQTHYPTINFPLSKIILRGKKNVVYLIIAILSFILGILVYQTLQESFFGKTPKTMYTNPALNYRELEEMYTSNKIINLSKEINDYASFKKYQGELTFLSVYFRNLNNGGYFGVNQNERFSPASLMKLPILITYLKKSEENPDLLSKKLKYTKQIHGFVQNIKPEKQLIEGQEYSIREMCEYMIKYSDNNASSFLESLLNVDDIKKTYEDVGIEFPKSENGTFDNNVKIVDYAGFFRILFNASYLSKESSEKALELLSKTDFRDGINLGVPNYIKIAHKFGERSIITIDNKEEKQLHDCGIVYYPNHPYIICVMTRGYNLEFLKESIADVSRTVYQEVISQYGENPLDIIENEEKNK